MALKVIFKNTYFIFISPIIKIMISFKILAISVAAVSVSFTVIEANKANVPIKIETGLITGIKSGSSNVVSYKGIPFALPPVGDLRWRAPQPVKPWAGVRNCDAYGNDPY